MGGAVVGLDGIGHANRLRRALVDGLLHRLSRAREPEAFVLRGGARLRRFMPDREVSDIDVVARLSFDPGEAHQRFATAAGLTMPDDVVFDEVPPGRLVFFEDGTPGLHLRVPGRFRDVPGVVPVDVRWGLDLGVPPTRESVPTRTGPAPLWVCQAPTQIARKLWVTLQLGARFRPKDLADLLALTQLPGLADRDLDRCVEALGLAPDAVLSSSLWRSEVARIRWNHFARRTGAHPSLDVVVGTLSGSLRRYRRWAR